MRWVAQANGNLVLPHCGMSSAQLKSSGDGFLWIREFNDRIDSFIHSHYRWSRSFTRRRRAPRWLWIHASHQRQACIDSGSATVSSNSRGRPGSSRNLQELWRINAKRPRKRHWWRRLFADDLEWWREHNDDAAMEDIGRMMLEDEEVKSWKDEVESVDDRSRYRKRGRGDSWEDWLLDDDSIEEAGVEALSGDEGDEVDEIEQELLQKKDEKLKYVRSELDSFGRARRETGPFSDLFQKPLEWHQQNKFERGFARSAARSTVKFVACLILIPWFADFVVHDCLLVPFLKRYVELVPLAAKAFDVTESQMLKIVIPPLEDEEKRLMFEVRIGIAPPISEEKLRERLHDEALEAIEEVKAENRSNFANLWSDLVAGIVLMLLIILNPVQVELMSYSGIRLFSNLSDIGKAFFIILLSDIFLGYHSESGWVTVVNFFLEHYGMKATEASISSFVAIVPVTIDACFKLWVFRNLPRLSPSLTAIFREMERH